MNPPHVPPASICPACLATLHALAASGQWSDKLYKRCWHNRVMAICLTQDNTITHWHLIGPADDDEFDEVGRQLLEEALQASLAAAPAG